MLFHSSQPTGASCANNNNPFINYSIELFIPPKIANENDLIEWNNALLLMKKSVKKMKIGGEMLRTEIIKQLNNLQIFRMKLFFKYF